MSEFRKQHMTVDWHDIVDAENTTPASEASLYEKSTLVGRVGLMMLSAGTGAWRVRASINKVSRALGVVTNADIGLLSVNYTCFEKGHTYTNAVSLNTTGVNTTKIYAMKQFCDSFGEHAGKYSVEQFHRILDKIGELPEHYKPWQLGLAAAAACGAFTFLLGGGIAEMICAFFGAGIGNFIRKKMLQSHITLFANVTAGVAAACCVYVLLIKLGELIFHIPDVHQAGYICSMLFVIPGFPLITGGMDLAKLDLRSGLERITYALLIIILATMTGWITAVIFKFTPSDLVPMSLDPLSQLFLRMAASFCGVYCFSLMFNSTKKMALWAGMIGMIANTMRLELIDLTSVTAGAAAFAGALAAGLMASAFRKRIGCPRITLTVPSIVIMVPGMYMYRGIYHIALSDVATGALWLTRAALIVFALPLGLIFARIFTDENFRKSS